MKTTVEDLLKKTFIKLRSDYGFKKAYASPEHSNILKDFLNALFEGKMVITDVTFQIKKVLPPDQDGKRIIYDAYCSTSTGYHFVVEMQQKQSDLFGKRMIFYICTCVYRQGESGGTYDFEPVFLIVITDFDMKPFEKRLVNEVLLMEKETKVVFTEDFKIFFLSLAQVNKDWKKCETELERQLNLMKNMENLNKESEAYKSGAYRELFDTAEIASMAEEDIVAYKNSLMVEMERQSELEFAKKEGIEQGIERGIEQGIERGIEQGIERGVEQGKLEVARQMKKNGMSLGDILLYTGLTEEQVSSL